MPRVGAYTGCPRLASRIFFLYAFLPCLRSRFSLVMVAANSSTPPHLAAPGTPCLGHPLPADSYTSAPSQRHRPKIRPRISSTPRTHCSRERSRDGHQPSSSFHNKAMAGREPTESQKLGLMFTHDLKCHMPDEISIRHPVLIEKQLPTVRARIIGSLNPKRCCCSASSTLCWAQVREMDLGCRSFLRVSVSVFQRRDDPTSGLSAEP